MATKTIKLFCMQKDESDILEQWIVYHGYLFGLGNLHIIDNYSTDNSMDILKKYEKRGVHIYMRPDYKLKGVYLHELITDSNNKCDIAIPLDIDEFVALSDLSFIDDLYLKDANVLDRDLIARQHPEWAVGCDAVKINNYINSLPKYGRYAFMYYLTSRHCQPVYENPLIDVVRFDIVNYDNIDGKTNCNKKFFIPETLTSLDHGNHHGRVAGLAENQFTETRLVLFHYHNRGFEKLLQKCRNDVIGLKNMNNVLDVNEMQKQIRAGVIGSHNIQTLLNYSTGGGLMALSNCDEDMDDGGHLILALSKKISELK